MADTLTTRYEFTKPEIGASLDSWGTKLNGNWDDLDALLGTIGTPVLAGTGQQVDFPGGLRVCIGSVTPTASAAATWVFPGAFASALLTVVLATVRDDTGAYYARCRNLTASQVDVRAFDATGTAVETAVNVVAIGPRA